MAYCFAAGSSDCPSVWIAIRRALRTGGFTNLRIAAMQNERMVFSISNAANGSDRASCAESAGFVDQWNGGQLQFSVLA